MPEHADDLYHEGERRIQLQAGEQETARSNAQNIAKTIPPAARGFIAQQSYVLIGFANSQKEIWAAFLAGPKGFAKSSEEGDRLHFRINDPIGVLEKNTPFSEISPGDYLGVLFIELASRRRLRVNGQVTEAGGPLITMGVSAAYPLCPKYIQRRRLEEVVSEDAGKTVETGTRITESVKRWIVSADTFFVASAHPEGPTDVSHRGGVPGFIQIKNGALTIPDYPGNSMFNTLGNFALNPRAGVTFLDFETNRQLQLTGSVKLNLDAEDETITTGGTGRCWQFYPERWFISPFNRNFRSTYIDASPFNPGGS